MKHNVGIRSLWFWLFVLQTIPVTIIFTWIFNNTSRSTLGAILFHFMTNLTAELTNRMDGTNLYSTALWSLAAVAVVACQGVGTSIRGEHG
ncbi:ABC-type sugar transport system permease subunit [Bradyrhizobium sp. USDA 328]